MLSINTNLSSLITQRSAKQATNILNQSIERMTTGYKINHAKDNAANYAIATNMSTKINSLMVAEDNVAQGLDLISTAESTLNILENRVTRLRDLQEQASNGTYGADSLKAINSECNALIDEINRLYETSQYNGINLFLETTTLADGREVVVKESDAELDTTFKDLGITSREFEVYDSNNNLIQAYDLEEDDTVRDFFTVLQSHGFTTSLGNGEIALSSVDDYHIGGLLADELGISTARQSFISQTEQAGSMQIETTSANVSSTTIYVTTTSQTTKTNTLYTTTTTETTQTNTLYTTTTTSETRTNTLGTTATLGAVDTSSSEVTYTDVNYADETTELGSIIDFSGVTKSVYIKDSSGAVIATQGFGASDTVLSFLDFCTTNGVTAVINNGVISFTSTGNYYLEDVDTNGIIEQLGITSTSTTVVDGTSANSTEKIYYTEETTASTSTTFAELGMTANKTAVVKNSSNAAKKTITMSTTNTIADFITQLSNNSITATMTDGVLTLTSSAGNTITGDLATLFGISQKSTKSTVSTLMTATLFGGSSTTTTISATGTSSVKPSSVGNFMKSVTKVSTTGLMALSDVTADDWDPAGTYKISTTDDIDAMLSSRDDFMGVTLVLANDIDLSGHTYSSGSGVYGGIFEGNGYVISNYTNDCALFLESVTVKNLGMEAANVVYDRVDNNAAAIMVEWWEAELYNCYVTGNLTAETTDGIGGLAGCLTEQKPEQSIDSCYFVGTINVTPSTYGEYSAAGILGAAWDGTIENCYSSVVINDTSGGAYCAGIGGIVGYTGDDVVLGSNYSENVKVITHGEATSSTKLSDAGVTSGKVKVNKSNGTIVTITIDSTKTFANLNSQLSSYGLAVSVTDGEVKITGTGNAYLSAVSGGSNICTVMGSVTKQTKTVYSNTTTATMQATSTVSLNASLKTAEIPDYSNGNGEILVHKADGTNATITVSDTTTMQQFIEMIDDYGIVGTISADGKLTLVGTGDAYLEEITGGSNLLTALKLSDVSKSTTTTTSISPSAQQNAMYTYSITGTSTLANLGINTNQAVTVVQNGTEKEVTFNTTDTLNTFITNLAGVGITASVADGKLTVSGSDTAYIKVMSNALQTALNLSGNFSTVTVDATGTEEVTVFVTTTTSTTETQTILVTTTTSTTETQTVMVTTTSSSTQTSTVWITSTVSATGATTFEQAGVNRSFKVTIMSEGTKNVLNITKDTSFADFYNELQTRGFNITENVDSITFVGQGDTYLKSNELNNLLKFSALNKTEAERIINTKSNHQTYNEILENVYAPGKVNLQIGLNADSNSQIEVDVSFKLGAVNGLRNIGLDTSTDYLTQIDSVLADIREKQTHLGAASNRLESALDEISIQYENLVSSRSTIRDADIADETSSYIQAQILQQAAATLMATANQSPSIALQLI